MPYSDLLPSLYFKINENQLALETAILELANRAEQHGSTDVADNVRSAMDTIDKNEEFIKMTRAVMMTSERLSSAKADEDVVNPSRIVQNIQVFPRTS